MIYMYREFFCLSESQDPTFTSAPTSPVQVVEGENVTLDWTYNTGGSAFQEAEFESRGFPFIVKKTTGASAIIFPAFVGRLTANITETNASITFLAVSRSDSRVYEFVVFNKNFGTALDDVTMDVQCKSTFFFILLVFMTVVCHFQKVLETLQMHMRVPESFLHLAINHNGYFSGLKEMC